MKQIYSTSVISCLLVGYPILSSRRKNYWELVNIVQELTKTSVLFGKELEIKRLKAKNVFLEQYPVFKELFPKSAEQLKVHPFYTQMRNQYGKTITL